MIFTGAVKVNKRNILMIIGGIVVLLIGVGIGIAGSGSNKTASPTPTVTVTVPGPKVTVPGPKVTVPGPKVTVTQRAKAAPRFTITAKPKAPAAAARTTMSADGVYVVGTDIMPGTYHTSGALGGSGGNCYYALLSSTNTSDIIDNNNITGPATITVGSGVRAVDVSGCLPWHRL